MYETIARYVGQQLHWVQPKTFEQNYELRAEQADEKVLGVLAFPKVFGSLAVAATAQDAWTFKRVGFFNPKVSVRREGEEMDIAIYHPKWSGMQGTLEFSGGTIYLWSTANFWATRFQFADAHGQVLITYQSGLEEWKLSDMFKSQARVEIAPAAASLPDLSILVLLGWYLILLQQQDSSAAAAAASASS